MGSKQDHKDLLQFLSEKRVDLQPTVDKVFNFDDSRKAFKYLYSAAHTEKWSLEFEERSSEQAGQQ